MGYYIGIDCGSSVTKGVLMKDTELLKCEQLKTAHRPKQAMANLLEKLALGIEPQELKVITTGYGRELLGDRDKSVTEISCHAKGAHYLGQRLGKSIRTVIDIGGQDVKVIVLDDQGQVSDFLMNDKCAAGTGRFVEVLMDKLGQQVEQLDAFVKDAMPVKISSMCTVFAESEVIGLLASEVTASAIAMGIVHSIADRTANFARRLPLTDSIFFSGGLARSQALKACLESGVNQELVVHELSQYAGAIGAALIGQKSRRMVKK